jgi:flagellar hook-associated protein 1 FlgK
MGLFSVLGTGTRALSASQLGMDITGQNIANADVDGYSRKRLNQTAEYRYDSTFGQTGMGVDVVNIERMRDAAIDEQIRHQNEELGLYQQLDYTLERIENIFTEPTDAGVLKFVDQFFDSWQNLANNPADLSARTMVRTNAEIMVNVMHNLSAELSGLRQSLNVDLKGQVDRVNELSVEIYNINQEIAAVEVRDQNANDSRDKRDRLVKELSGLIDVSITENARGQISISTGGSLIVSPVYHQQLETTTTSIRQPDGTTVTDFGIRFSASKQVFTPKGGQIRGIFEARDRVVPEMSKKLDELALQLADSVNGLHQSGYTLMGYSGMSFFDPSMTGAADIQISAAVTSDLNNIAAASAGSSQIATTNLAPAGTLNFGTLAQPLSKSAGVIPAPTTQEQARNILAGSVQVRANGALLQEGADYHIDYALGTIQMLHNGYDGQAVSVDFDYRTGGFQGPGDNSNALSIAKLRDNLTMEPNTVGEPTSTFTEFYSSFIGKLGLNRKEAASNVETREYLVEQFMSHQDSISGVSLDEEMANLIRFQHTYQAAARLISTADRMMEVLFNI